MTIKRWIAVTLWVGVIGLFSSDLTVYFLGMTVAVLWGIYFEIEVLVKEVREIRRSIYFSEKEKEE